MEYSFTETEQKFRQYFKSLNRFMLMMWRLGLGPWINIWPEVFGRIMVITHTGRVTGLRRQTPVNYEIVDGEIYCVAGFGPGADWYQNMIADPQVEVWLPDGWWKGVAEDVSDIENRLHIMRQVIIASGFAGRMFGLDANMMTDEELDRITDKYRLMCISRGEAQTGSKGPNDLAWVWPLATMILLPLVFCRRRRKR
jgi:deazaflavin-dependent oxidoreductase (nitroreductase family)